MSTVGRSKKEDEVIIGRAGFYPATSVTHFRKAMRVTSTVENDLVESNLRYALVRLMGELREFEIKYRKEGYQSIEEIPPSIDDPYNPKVDDTTYFMIHYESALYNYAMSYILESNLRTYDLTRRAGEDRSSKEEPNIHELRSRASESVLILTEGVSGYSRLI